MWRRTFNWISKLSTQCRLLMQELALLTLDCALRYPVQGIEVWLVLSYLMYPLLERIMIGLLWVLFALKKVAEAQPWLRWQQLGRRLVDTVLIDHVDDFPLYAISFDFWNSYHFWIFWNAVILRWVLLWCQLGTGWRQDLVEQIDFFEAQSPIRAEVQVIQVLHSLVVQLIIGT